MANICVSEESYGYKDLSTTTCVYYLTFLSECAALRNLLMKQYGVGTDILNLSVFTIILSCRNINVSSSFFICN
jgi:hypothetical protein